MRVIEFKADRATAISQFASAGASSVALGHGSGELHAYVVHFGANSKIGDHPTGFCQLFLVVEGAGWAAGPDCTRVDIHAGQGVFFERGEVHSKGSDSGMIAVMIQGTEIDPATEPLISDAPVGRAD